MGDLSASDPDVGDTFVYTLLDSAGGRFATSGSQVVVANGALLDYETATHHAIRVRTTDRGGTGLSFEKDLTISVLDMDEIPPTATVNSLTTNDGTTYDVDLLPGGRLPAGQVTIANLTGSPGADNILDIWFIDTGGGQNLNWVVSGIEISSGSLPAAIEKLLADEAGPAAGGGVTIGHAMLAPLVAEAAARWSAADLTPAQSAVLSDLHVGVADLGGATLGLAYPTTIEIRIDNDAAGWGWRWAVDSGQGSGVRGQGSVISDR